MPRISKQNNEWINRNKKLSFEFEGKKYEGLEGDTITSALLANGVKVLARSFKYHRPRSVLTFSNHDANIIMQDDGGSFSMANIRADVVALKAGMKLSAVNTFGDVNHDKASILGNFSKFLPVGFYYKAFHTKALFMQWEKMFRALTGLGKVDLSAPRVRTPKKYDFCDVLVVGGGASGLSAAITAADLGLDVVVVDENQKIGGSINYTNSPRDLIEKAKANSKIRIIENAYASGYYADNWIPIIDKDKMTKMRAKTVIVAQGAFEQPCVFHNNDLPNIMTMGAGLKLLNLYAVQTMKTAVCVVANEYGYEGAVLAMDKGVKIAAIIDMRDEASNSLAAQRLKDAGTKIYAKSCIYEAEINSSKDGVKSVKIANFIANKAGNVKAEIECDGVLMAIGYAPAANLLYQANTKMTFDEEMGQFVPEVLPKAVFACGKVNGKYSYENRVKDGALAALKAAKFLGQNVEVLAEVKETLKPNFAWPIVEHPKGKNFVDMDEDLQLKDFKNAVQEGFDNIELLKRYSTNGMGPSQGKHSNMNGLRVLGKLTGKKPQEVGTTTARPNYHPVFLSHMAGRSFSPERLTPLHSRHEKLGAVFMNAGVWKRPEYYANKALSRKECIEQEAMNIHNNVGIIDVGTLGKIEISGKDAGEFLERIYISKYKDLKVGRGRYGIMCDETGVVIDDGIIARIGEDKFYFTTTTSNAATIYRELSRLNTMWKLDCGIVNLTGAMGAINLAGPKSRELLAQVCDLDLSAKAFPFMGVKITKVCGVEARLIRAGFVGEWGYEIHAPANEMAKIWDELMERGKGMGIAPFGVEAQRLLRLQKGHIIIGQDTDGLTTPYEANLGFALKMDKPFFIGKRSLQIIAKKPQRHILCGIEIIGNEAPKECNLVIENGEIKGRVTSVSYSKKLNKIIGLAYVAPEQNKDGNIIKIKLSNGTMIDAKIVTPTFYDPSHNNQKEAA